MAKIIIAYGPSSHSLPELQLYYSLKYIHVVLSGQQFALNNYMGNSVLPLHKLTTVELFRLTG